MQLYYLEINDYTIDIDISIFPLSLQKHIEKYQGKDKINSYYAYKILYDKIDDFNIEFSLNGKPLFKNHFVSISHSENMVLVAISLKNVGIDLQCHKKISKSLIDKIVPNNHINAVYNDNNLFFNYWCLMEAKCKYDDGKLVNYFKQDITGKTLTITDRNKNCYTIGIVSNDTNINIKKMEINNGNINKKSHK